MSSENNQENQESRRPVRRIQTQRSIGARELFRRYDTNQDGQISLCELRNLITSENYAEDLPPAAVTRILNEADQNLDGHLDYKEFKTMVSGREWQSIMNRAVQQYIRKTIPRRLVEDEPDGTGQYEEEYSCWPPVLGMVIISIIEVTTFLVDLFNADTVDANGPVALKLMYTPFRRFEAWRYLTYMFVHVGVIHLVVNLLVQLLLGVPLEMVHRWWRVLIIYFAGVVAGSLGTSITDPTVLLAGASGGVYAILFAHIATIIMNWSEMSFAPYQLGVFLVLIVTDVGTAIYNRYFSEETQPIGYSAHFAGALAGLLLGINILRNLQVKSWEKKLWWASICIYVALMVGAIIWNACYTDYFPPQDKH
ncbi:Rhomboid-related protein 3 [Blattella germanica]|nr:Rhomboid-related protein 3 [Blattella germanica]